MATTKKTNPKAKTTKKSSAGKTASKKVTAKKTSTTKKSVSKKTPKQTSRSAATAKKTTTAKAKVKSSKATKKASIKKTKSPLKWFLIVGSVLSATLAVAVILFGNKDSIGVISLYLTDNQLADSGKLLPAVTELFRVNLAYLISAILLAAAAWRIALLSVLKKRYQTQLDGKFTSLNWVEFSVSVPLIFSVIGLLVGIRDVVGLLLLIGVPAGIGVLGYLSDRYSMLQNRSWIKLKIALEALFLPWLAVAIALLHSYIYGFVSFSVWFYLVLLAVFLAYCLLAAVQKKRILGEAKFVDFMFGEKIVVGLNLVLLLLLGALAFV